MRLIAIDAVESRDISGHLFPVGLIAVDLWFPLFYGETDFPRDV